VPYGVPGLETEMPVIYSEGVGHDRISLQTFVAAFSTNPARIFGLYPQKGVIAPGSDADVVVWDPSRPSRLTPAGLGDGLDWSPYEGIDVPGSLRCVLASGDCVVEEGRFTGDEHRGAYLPVGRVSALA
jgi:dihydropyrimidinase